jgi:multicomponent Na+:H+ antiporter subunit D
MDLVNKSSQMISFFLILLSPLLALTFLPLKRRNRILFYAMSIAIAMMDIVLCFYCPVDTKIDLDPIPFRFIVDRYSKVFLLLIGFSWLISIVYCYEFTKYHFQQKTTEFFLYLNTLLTVVMLNASAGNMLTLFVFYLLGIPLTYPLIKIRGTSTSKISAIKFRRQTLWPSLFILLPAVLSVIAYVGNAPFGSMKTLGAEHVSAMEGGILLLMFVVGISKNSVFPFHTWLPSTSQAPAPVSGLIHSIGTVKTGSIAMIKLAVYVFGLDYVQSLTANFFTGGWLCYLCGFTSIYAAYRALKTDDLKVRFGYSTVSQLSYIILAILTGSANGIFAATLHIVTHGIAKSCLFYVAGFYNSVYKTVKVFEIGKIMPSTPFVAFVIAVCGLSITGFPFLAGFYSKDLMLIEEWNGHYYASAAFLLIGSVINIFYIIGPVKNVFNARSNEIEKKPIPISMFITFVVCVALIVGGNLYVPYIIQIMK